MDREMTAELQPVKQYLTDHSAQLEEQVGLLREQADAYYDLAKSVNFDYSRLLQEHGDEVEEILGSFGLKRDGWIVNTASLMGVKPSANSAT